MASSGAVLFLVAGFVEWLRPKWFAWYQHAFFNQPRPSLDGFSFKLWPFMMWTYAMPVAMWLIGLIIVVSCRRLARRKKPEAG
jgi:TRAP-type C4-dicarboxylate transport system permease small subunit